MPFNGIKITRPANARFRVAPRCTYTQECKTSLPTRMSTQEHEKASTLLHKITPVIVHGVRASADLGGWQKGGGW
jgi:hypothetical protein